MMLLALHTASYTSFACQSSIQAKSSPWCKVWGLRTGPQMSGTLELCIGYYRVGSRSPTWNSDTLWPVSKCLHPLSEGVLWTWNPLHPPCNTLEVPEKENLPSPPLWLLTPNWQELGCLAPIPLRCRNSKVCIELSPGVKAESPEVTCVKAPFISSLLFLLPFPVPRWCFLPLCWVSLSVTQSCLILCDPTNHSPPGSSVHGILQARLLEWIAIPLLQGTYKPRNWTWSSCIKGRFFAMWTAREAHPTNEILCQILILGEPREDTLALSIHGHWILEKPLKFSEHPWLQM